MTTILRSRSRRRSRMRRLAGVAGVTAVIGAARKRAIAANERRYADDLGFTARAERPGEGAASPKP